MAFSAPSLSRICVKEIVQDIKLFCYCLNFDDLGKSKYLVGPLHNLSSQCIEAIFEYVMSTKQLNNTWLSLLIVPHVRVINFKKFPGEVTPRLFKMLINRCQLLERLIIPNCRKIPNATLSNLIAQNPSLLELDISNKVSPKVDVSIVNTLAESCRYLTVLKLSDYRVSDPKTLLVLCGKRVIQRSQLPDAETPSAMASPVSICHCCSKVVEEESLQMESNTNPTMSTPSRPMEVELNENQLAALSLNGIYVQASGEDTVLDVSTHSKVVHASHFSQFCQCVTDTSLGQGESSSIGNCVDTINEEQQNQRVNEANTLAPHNDHQADLAAENSDEDIYESDGSLTALAVEDCGCDYGCLDLETLWLDNVNITDQVMAVLLQHLPRLRDLNLSDTDICNPWRLLDPSCCLHLLELEELDIKSTALSRTALELIPKFHPDLYRFSISTTTLPPHTYANIGQLTGVADLELIGGQFYPCEPKEIFHKGIAPAISSIGLHLRLLNLTYFAHVEFEVIPKNCPKLEQLDLSSAGVIFQYPCLTLGECCSNLKYLNLAFSHIEAKQVTADDQELIESSKAVQAMIGQPTKLLELNISGLGVSDEALKSIFPRAIHPLQVLNLSRCSIATVNGIRYIWSRCPYLHTLDLTYCKEVTVNDFNAFKNKCFEERPQFKLEGKLSWK